MKVRCGLDDSWVGWSDSVETDEEKLKAFFKNLCPQAAGKSNHEKLREKRWRNLGKIRASRCKTRPTSSERRLSVRQ